VTYFLDGEKKGWQKKKPFIWGGKKKGFDTRRISNNPHVIRMEVQTATGVEVFAITIYVQN